MRYLPGVTETLIATLALIVMVVNFLLGSWLYGVFGIGGLIGWGLGFFLVSGIVFHVIWGKDAM